MGGYIGHEATEDPWLNPIPRSMALNCPALVMVGGA